MNSKTKQAPKSRYFLAQLNFPAKLDRILRSPELSDIICWLPHGRSWRVLQQKRFEKEVLPVFFRHCNYSSFIRQVNGWGFRRIQTGPDFNSYYHESFLRDDKESHQRMNRPTNEELIERKNTAGDPPPNFYAMPPLAAAKPEAALLTEVSCSLQQDLYGETIARKLSLCSVQGKHLLLHMEMARLESQRRRVLAALQAVEPKSAPAVVSPLLSQIQPLKAPPAGAFLGPTAAKSSLDFSSMTRHAAREILLQMQQQNRLMSVPNV